VLVGDGSGLDVIDVAMSFLGAQHINTAEGNP